MSSHREIEHTYDRSPDTVLPDLRRLPRVREVGEPQQTTLDAVYFDTDDLDLAQAGVTLRRRTGGTDQGWHLKVPAGKGRDEVHLPLSRATRTPPKPLRQAVTAWTRGRPLGPVATVRTRRTTRTLVGKNSVVLAELADDEVEAEVHLEAGRPASWREWELELVEGTHRLLAEADSMMTEVGAPPSDAPRKIARVLGHVLPEAPVLEPPGPKEPAARVLHARLAEQVAELKRRDSEVRRDTGEGVHKARVALRRLRSALATYRPLVDRDVTDPVRDEMKWAAGVLGEARDSEVVHARLRALVETQPSALVVGAVRGRVDRTLLREYRAARATVLETLDSERYLALLHRLDLLVERPPWTEQAEAPAREVLPRRVGKDFKRLRRRVRALDEAEGPRERDAALHEVRKGAKRLRYAVETLLPAWHDGSGGDDGPRRLTKAAKRIQSTLGEHQDAVVSRQVLLRMAEDAAGHGESAFTFGRLHAAEEHRADDLEEVFGRQWRRARRKRMRSWLD